MARPRLLIKFHYGFSVGWYMRSLNDRQTSFLCVVGLPYLEAYLNSAHTFLPCPQNEAMVPIEVIVPSSRLALANKVLDSRLHRPSRKRDKTR